MCCQKFLLLLSRATMKMPCFPTKYTAQQKQKWEADTDTSLSSANGEPNFPALSPGRSENSVVRSKSPGNRIHPISPNTKIYTATEPTGIIKSGTSYIIEAHVPRLRDEDESTMVRYDPNSRDMFSRDDLSNALISERSDELNRDHTRVPLARLSSILVIHSNADEDRSSSSGNQFDASSSNYQSEASSSSTQSEPLARWPNGIVQTEPIDNLKMKKKPHVAFGETNLFGPPPPCAHCNNEYHFGRQSRRFSSEEVKIATDCYNFHVDLEEQLFKGFLADQPVYVARKVFEERSKLSSEVDILKGLQHPNIVTLRGFCDEDNSQALVFNFVCNRTLFFNLSPKHLKTMPWAQRAKLAVELARGLVYLHEERIIHGRVNSKNVFVTHDLVPVIGDFSLSRRMPARRDIVRQDQSEDKKARGYLAPEYSKREFKPSEKQDVYAFGVILFELVSGRAAFDRSCEICYLDKWGRDAVKEFEPNERAKLLETMADPRLKGSDFSEHDMFQMIRVGDLCTRPNPKRRPRMKEVLNMLLMGDIIDVERSQEPPEQPAVPNHDRPVMQLLEQRLRPSSDQNPMKCLQTLLKRLLERIVCGKNSFEPVTLTVSPKHIHRAERTSRTPTAPVRSPNSTPARPPEMGQSTRARSPRAMSPRRPRYGKRPSTPRHPNRKSRSGHRGLLGDGGTKLPTGFPMSPRCTVVHRHIYIRRSCGPYSDRNPLRVRFAKPKSRNLFKINRLD